MPPSLRPSAGSQNAKNANIDNNDAAVPLAAEDKNQPNDKKKKKAKRDKKVKPAAPTVHLLRTRSERRPDLLDRAFESERTKEQAMGGSMQLQHAQVQVVERERDAAFQRAHAIMSANEQLERELILADRDVQDVVASLKTSVQQKEQLRMAVEADVREVETNKQLVLKSIDDSYAHTIRALKQKLMEKNSTLRQMNRDFHLIEEHHRHRHHVQEMLENIRHTIYKREKRHREVLNDIERRFLQEREVLQTEACKRLTMFGEKSYEEAVKNIDTQTRQVFNENNTQAAELELCLARTKKLSERVVLLNNAVEQVSQQQTIEAETMHAMDRMKQHHTQKQAELEQQTINLRKTLQSAIDDLHSRYAQLQQYYTNQIQQRDDQINTLQTAVSQQTVECNQLRKRRRTLDAQRRQVECFLLDMMTEAEQHARDDAAAAVERKNKHYVAKTLTPLRQRTSTFTTQHYPAQKHSAQADNLHLQYIDQPLPDGPAAATRDFADIISHFLPTTGDRTSATADRKTDFSQLSWHQKAIVLRSLYLHMTRSAVRRAKHRKRSIDRQPCGSSTSSVTAEKNQNHTKPLLSLEPATASAATSPPLALPPKAIPTDEFLSESDAAILERVKQEAIAVASASLSKPKQSSAADNDNSTACIDDAKVKLDLLLKRVEET